METQALKSEFLTRTENNAVAISKNYFQQNTQTALTAMNYQLVNKNNFQNIREYLLQILQSDSKISKVYACLLIMHFRDIEFGKGLRKPFLESLLLCYENGLQSFVCKVIPEIPSLGYYKDLCNLYLIANEYNYEDLKQSIIDCYSEGLIYEAKKKVPYGLKNCGKFAPRQQKKFHVFATDLAKHLYPDSKQPFKDYRKFISYIMQKYSQITEILMSNKQWDKIDPKFVPSLCFQRYKKIFLKDEKNDEKKQKLRENYTRHINKALRGEDNCQINAKRITVDTIVGQFLQKQDDELQLLALEAQFLSITNDIKKKCSLLKKCVAICDVSGSMNGIPMNACLGLGIVINEISEKKHHNLMTFSEEPSWINLGDAQTYKEKIDSLRQAPWGCSTNFESALKLLVQLERHEIPEILFVFSDMQFNQASREHWGTTMNVIEKLFKKQHDMEPQEIPTIVFWNLRATGNFVVEHNRKKVITIAGYSQNLVKGITEAPNLEHILNMTPFTFLLEILDNKRYQKIKDIALETIQ